ncbi:MAG TPA: hypothetical protein VLN90_01870 [Thioalkalivibrio sp.]|nr:hypothetical protein [Thioalkalivibrio sp.]
MKKFFFYTLLALPVLALLMLWLGGKPQDTGYQDLPWQVEVAPDSQRAEVFGITLGETPLDAVREKFKLFPSLGLFVLPDGTRTLEAYFGSVKLGPFEANLVTLLAADEALLEAIMTEGVGNKPMPSGARRPELSEEMTRTALSLPVREITYVPRARYDAEVVLRRFGEPDQRLPAVDGRQYWLYPDMGLVLMLNEGGRDMLHYSPPAEFASVRDRILRGEGLESLVQ